MNLSWLSNLTKPFSSLLNPIAERIGDWLGRRKPHLYLHVQPATSMWSIAPQPQRDGSSLELMHVVFCGGFNHDDRKQTLVITSAYPEGTEPKFRMIENLSIPPETIVNERVDALVLPVRAKKEKPWTGRFILVDQFQRKYKTKKITFQWAGPPTTK